MNRLIGSEPTIGRYEVRMSPDKADWCIFMWLADKDMIERWCSTWSTKPCNGLTKVYAILREHGFTMAGYQSAKVINL